LKRFLILTLQRAFLCGFFLFEKALCGCCFWRRKKMMRLWISYLQLVELFVSSLVHLLYGFYIFSTAVAGDLAQNLNEYFRKPNADVVEVKDGTSKANADDLPPIVLVHGIFGFGKGVSPIAFIPFFSSQVLPFFMLFFCFSSGVLICRLSHAEIGGFVVLWWGGEERWKGSCPWFGLSHQYLW